MLISSRVRSNGSLPTESNGVWITSFWVNFDAKVIRYLTFCFQFICFEFLASMCLYLLIHLIFLSKFLVLEQSLSSLCLICSNHIPLSQIVATILSPSFLVIFSYLGCVNFLCRFYLHIIHWLVAEDSIRLMDKQGMLFDCNAV